MSPKLPSWLKQPAVLWTLAALVLFIGLPELTVIFGKPESAMASALLLFFAIDPMFAIAAGMFAGKRPRQLWFLPIANPVLFVLGTWLCFDFGNPDFFSYALMYLLLGGTTMFVFLLMTNGRRK